MALHWRLLASALFHAAFGCSAYYHMSPLNNIQSDIEIFINQSFTRHYGVNLSKSSLAWIWAGVAASVDIGAVFGAFILKYPLEIWGRRNTVMILKNIIQIIGSLLMFVSKPAFSFELLLVGRVVAGVSIGMAMCIPVYLTECAPIEYRGIVATISYLGTPFWTIIGSIVGMPQVLGLPSTWHYVLVIAVAPAIVHALFTPFIAESPKFLHITRGNREASAASVAFYHGPNADIETALAVYDREAEIDKSEKEQSVGLKEVLRTRHFLWPFVLCLVANVAQDFGGTDLAFQYSTGFMQLLGISKDMSSVFTVAVTQIPGLFICILGMFLVERCGRRFLYLLGILLGIFAMTFVFIAGLLPKGNTAGSILGIIGLFLSIAGYYIGPSFIAGLLPGELCPQSSRSFTSGISFASSWFPVVIIVLFYPPLQLAIGSYSVLPLVILGIMSFIFLYIYLPETKGQPVDVIVRRWIREDGKPEDERQLLGKTSNASVESYGSGIVIKQKEN